MKKIILLGIICSGLYLLIFRGCYYYDNKKAVTYIENNFNSKSKSMCAWYVMKAIRKGGCYNCYIYPAYAYNDILIQLGFKEISLQNYSPIKGDISVLPANSHSPFGHIAIYNGKYWISDFKQNSIYPGSSYRKVQTYQIFRITDGWHHSHLQFNLSNTIKYLRTLKKGYKRIKILD